MENSHLTVKIDLRRHFLDRYHSAGERRVFDAFQAKGLLWSILREEFPLTSYWGVDLVEKKGRVKVDSARVLVQPGWNANIVDLDAYGSPWKHWLGVIWNSPGSVTVFFTVGSKNGLMARNISAFEKKLLGIPFRKLPGRLGKTLDRLVLDFMLGEALERFDVIEATEALPSTTARYFGVRLEGKNQDDLRK
jgi:hypothetical protein